MTRAAMLIYESRGSGLRLSDALQELLETRVLPHATQSNAEEWRKELGSLEVHYPVGSLCMRIGVCTAAHSHKQTDADSRGALQASHGAAESVHILLHQVPGTMCTVCSPHPLVVARFSTEHCTCRCRSR